MNEHRAENGSGDEPDQDAGPPGNGVTDITHEGPDPDPPVDDDGDPA